MYGESVLSVLWSRSRHKESGGLYYWLMFPIAGLFGCSKITQDNVQKQFLKGWQHAKGIQKSMAKGHRREMKICEQVVGARDMRTVVPETSKSVS